MCNFIALLLTCIVLFDFSMFLSRIIIIPCVRLMLLYGRQPASHFWSDYQQKNSTDPDYAAWCRHRCRKLNWKKISHNSFFPLLAWASQSLARFSHKFHSNGTEHHLLTRPNFFLILFFTTLFSVWKLGIESTLFAVGNFSLVLSPSLTEFSTQISFVHDDGGRLNGGIESFDEN